MTKSADETGVVWPPAMAPIAEHLRANTELITQMHQIVSRAARSMAARQSAVITEAVADITTLMRAAMPNPNDPTATARAYAAYVEAVVQRGMSQLNFSVETISEMSASALDLARQRFASGEHAQTDTPPSTAHRHTPRK